MEMARGATWSRGHFYSGVVVGVARQVTHSPVFVGCVGRFGFPFENRWRDSRSRPPPCGSMCLASVLVACQCAQQCVHEYSFIIRATVRLEGFYTDSIQSITTF
jgi:hypothetical protein